MTTLAHFTLDYPYSRGFIEDDEGIAPCGSFNTPNATLTPWYYLDGPVEIDSHHDTATVQIFMGSSKAATLSDFKGKNLTDVMSITGQGEFCFKVNASTPSTHSNTTAVLMVEHVSVHGHLYQCSDVIFSKNASLGSNISCTNSLTATPSSSGGEDDASADKDSSSSSSKKSGAAVMTSHTLSTFFTVLLILTISAVVTVM